MKQEIPTAEEFFEQGGTYPELAIKFAQLHVKQALLEASEKVEYEVQHDSLLNYCAVTIDKQSILNSYDINKIK